MIRTNTSRTLSSSFTTRIPLMALLVALALVAISAVASAQERATRRRGTTTTAATTTTTGSTAARESSYQTTTSAARAQRTTWGSYAGTTYATISGGGFDGGGIGYHLGGTVDVPVNGVTGIVVKGGFESKNYQGTISSGTMSVATTIQLNYLDVSGAVRYDISPDMLLEGGVAMQLGAGGSVTLANVASGEGELRVPTQVALTSGVGYRVKLANGSELVPAATFNYFLTSPSSNGNVSSHTLRVGARMMF